jgi:hypothetical protein
VWAAAGTRETLIGPTPPAADSYKPVASTGFRVTASDTDFQLHGNNCTFVDIKLPPIKALLPLSTFAI